jgi:hypothetical protein
MPENKCPAIVAPHLEIKVIRFTPGLEKVANFDLAVTQEKRQRPLICPGTSYAPDGRTIPGLEVLLGHGFTEVREVRRCSDTG